MFGACRVKTHTHTQPESYELHFILGPYCKTTGLEVTSQITEDLAEEVREESQYIEFAVKKLVEHQKIILSCHKKQSLKLMI